MLYTSIDSVFHYHTAMIAAVCFIVMYASWYIAANSNRPRADYAPICLPVGTDRSVDGIRERSRRLCLDVQPSDKRRVYRIDVLVLREDHKRKVVKPRLVDVSDRNVIAARHCRQKFDSSLDICRLDW